MFKNSLKLFNIFEILDLVCLPITKHCILFLKNPINCLGSTNKIKFTSRMLVSFGCNDSNLFCLFFSSCSCCSMCFSSSLIFLSIFCRSKSSQSNRANLSLCTFSSNLVTSLKYQDEFFSISDT